MSKRVLYSDNFGLARIAALSDGVFSIVITLLVFDLKLPATVTVETLNRDVAALLPKFAAYVLTFFIIGIYWIGHHGVMRHIVRYDRAYLWKNIVFLLFVAFLPFPTSLLGSFPAMQLSSVMYGLTLIGSGLALRGLWRDATESHRLVDPGLDARIIALAHQRILLAPLAAFVSIVVSFVSVKASVAIYLIAGVAYFFPSRLDRHSATSE